MSTSLVGLSSSDVVYAQQAATHVTITLNGITVHVEIDGKKKGLNVVNINFIDKKHYHSLKSKLTNSPQHVATILFHFKALLF